jgi:hypothetical protein
MTAIFSFFCGIALSSLWYAQGRQLGSYVPFFLIKAGALSIHLRRGDCESYKVDIT